MIHLSDIDYTAGGRSLLRNVSFHLREGARVALIGVNGSGKSTLLRLMAGQLQPDAGAISRRRGIRVSYLPQLAGDELGGTLREAAFAVFGDTLALLDEKRLLEQRLAGGDQACLARYTEVSAAVSEDAREALEGRVAEVLSGLGFALSDWERPVDSLSGGWRMRVRLARLLLEAPDVMLLDEPTNYLDLEARGWLTEFLLRQKASQVLVAHDAWMLRRLAVEVAEMEGRTLHTYRMGYDQANTEKEVRQRVREASLRRKLEERKKLEAFVERFRYNAATAARAQSRLKAIERLDAELAGEDQVEGPPPALRFRLPPAPRSAREVIVLRGLSFGYGGRPLYRDVDLTVYRGDRVALVGPNGAGKTTLIRLMAGCLNPDAGTAALGGEVLPFYYDQDRRSDLDPGLSVLEQLQGQAPFEMQPAVRDILGAFGFSGDDAAKPVSVLSGGELSRLSLARMLLRRQNLLVLDEPTNHLDLRSKQVLLEVLLQFDGTLVFVSHDREFLDRLPTRVVRVGEGGAVGYPGTYADYLALSRQAEPAPSIGGVPAERPAPQAGAGRGEWERQKRDQARLKRLKGQVAGLEQRIGSAESGLADLDLRMVDPRLAADFAELGRLTGERERLQRELDRLLHEWEQACRELDREQDD